MLVEKTRTIIPTPIRLEMAQSARERAEMAKSTRDTLPVNSELWKYYNLIFEAELEAVDFWHRE